MISFSAFACERTLSQRACADLPCVLCAGEASLCRAPDLTQTRLRAPYASVCAGTCCTRLIHGQLFAHDKASAVGEKNHREFH